MPADGELTITFQVCFAAVNVGQVVPDPATSGSFQCPPAAPEFAGKSRLRAAEMAGCGTARRFVEFNDAKQDVFSLAELYRARLAVQHRLFDLPMFDEAGRGRSESASNGIRKVLTGVVAEGLARPRIASQPAWMAGCREEGWSIGSWLNLQGVTCFISGLLEEKRPVRPGVAFAGKRNGLNVP